MSANVETAAYANTPAWHREGVVLDTNGKKGMTVAQALKAAKLDWEVEKFPAYGMNPVTKKHEPIEGRYAVHRMSDGKALGTVGATWSPFQNADGFALIDDLIKQAAGAGAQVWIEAAGALDGGRKVWVLAHIESGWQIAGEKYAEYVLFTNGHDGRTSVTAATTNVRVECQNMLTFALSTTQRVVRVRHTVKAADRIKEAAHILGLRNQYNEQLAIQAEQMAETSLNEAEFEKFLDALMPMAEEGTPAATMIGDRRDKLAHIYHEAPNLAPLRGTRWGAVQAVVEYIAYAVKRKDGAAALKAQWAINATPIKDDAFAILSRKRIAALK